MIDENQKKWEGRNFKYLSDNKGKAVRKFEAGMQVRNLNSVFNPNPNSVIKAQKNRKDEVMKEDLGD